MNILGSLLLALNTFAMKAYPSFITNLLWSLIGAYGLFHAVKHFRDNKKKKKN
jgi:hypothetical protein